MSDAVSIGAVPYKEESFRQLMRAVSGSA